VLVGVTASAWRREVTYSEEVSQGRLRSADLASWSWPWPWISIRSRSVRPAVWVRSGRMLSWGVGWIILHVNCSTLRGRFWVLFTMNYLNDVELKRYKVKGSLLKERRARNQTQEVRLISETNLPGAPSPSPSPASPALFVRRACRSKFGPAEQGRQSTAALLPGLYGQSYGNEPSILLLYHALCV
jgi:hypothetical protein